MVHEYAMMIHPELSDNDGSPDSSSPILIVRPLVSDPLDELHQDSSS
jgi:hypothetical protein